LGRVKVLLAHGKRIEGRWYPPSRPGGLLKGFLRDTLRVPAGNVGSLHPPVALVLIVDWGLAIQELVWAICEGVGLVHYVKLSKPLGVATSMTVRTSDLRPVSRAWAISSMEETERPLAP